MNRRVPVVHDVLAAKTRPISFALNSNLCRRTKVGLKANPLKSHSFSPMLHVKNIPDVRSSAANSPKREFLESGTCVAEWARQKGFNPRLVYQVLAGKRKCLRGQSFQIARALGMK